MDGYVSWMLPYTTSMETLAVAVMHTLFHYSTYIWTKMQECRAIKICPPPPAHIEQNSVSPRGILL